MSRLRGLAAAGQIAKAGRAAGQGLDDAASVHGKAQLVNSNADMTLADTVHASVVGALGEAHARARQTLGQISRPGV